MEEKRTPQKDKFERTLDLIEDERVKEALSLIFSMFTTTTTPKSKIRLAGNRKKNDEHRRN